MKTALVIYRNVLTWVQRTCCEGLKCNSYVLQSQQTPMMNHDNEDYDDDDDDVHQSGLKQKFQLQQLIL